MICNSCHATVPDGTPFCSNCGAKLSDAPFQPYFPAQPISSAQEPVCRPAQPLVGMICGIVSFILSMILYFVLIVGSVTRSVTWLTILFGLLVGGLAIFSMIFSIIGLRRSIRTGGRKYVPGIVFSAVGISMSASALLFLFLGILVGSLASNVSRRSIRYYY